MNLPPDIICINAAKEATRTGQEQRVPVSCTEDEESAVLNRTYAAKRPSKRPIAWSF